MDGGGKKGKVSGRQKVSDSFQRKEKKPCNRVDKLFQQLTPGGARCSHLLPPPTAVYLELQCCNEIMGQHTARSLIGRAEAPHLTAASSETQV